MSLPSDLPNIAHFILNNSTFQEDLNLKGILVGNGCWGGDADHVDCNGPNSEQNDLDMFYGKGMVSKESYEAAYKVVAIGVAVALLPLVSHSCAHGGSSLSLFSLTFTRPR